ncbi:unnamed protein product [Blepharisma stoltei]|uniref:EF-hand domain-containing protein n=1 Tax=Blepharisma stoltei TaxID=1481888 RepID=A0AAU9JZG7_9CILI|nr:unnamed protein product [Blepharisma stoltei]
MSNHQPLRGNRSKVSKTPPSFYNEEISINDIEERSPNKSTAKKLQNRPQSAKPTKSKNLKSTNQKVKRSSSVKRQPPKARTPAKPYYDSDMGILTKLKPGKIAMDKERLYEENMALKLQLNFSSEELIKFKTKITQLEKEICRKKDYFAEDLRNVDKYIPQNLKHVHLVSNLRQTVKDQKKELIKKENEILALKKSTKCTKTSELEIEIQAYIDECTRLRHHLEEVIRERETSQGTSEDHHAILKNLKKENQDLSLLMGQIKTEALHWKERAEKLEKLKKKSANSRDEPEALATENIHLKSQLESSVQSSAKKDIEFKLSLEQALKDANEAKNKLNIAEQIIKEQNKIIEKLQAEQKKSQGLPIIPHNILDNPNKLLVSFHKILTKRKIDIDTLLSQFDKNKKGNLELDEIVKGCKAYGEEISSAHVKEAIHEFTDKPLTIISLHKLRTQYERYVYRDIYLSSSEDEYNYSEEKKTAIQSPPLLPKETQITPPKGKQDLSPLKTTEKKPAENQIPTVKLSQVSDMMKHVSYRMQLHRLPKHKLSSALFDEKQKNDKPISYQELALLFTKKPFSIEEKSESITLAKFLIEPDGIESIPESQYKQLKSTPKQIIAKFMKFLDDWELFTLEDQEEFDKEIAMLVSSTYGHLNELCIKCDKNKAGMIKINEFKNALKELGAEIPKEVFNYMQLLFYSHNNELDSVPYKQFLNAYISQNEDGEHSDYSDEEQAKIVRQYLAIIAQNLNKLKKSVRTVFIADKKGRITPDQFVSALQYLEMGDIEKEHLILMIEALQFDEDQKDVFINIDELEEILTHYGVKADEIPDLPSSDDLQLEGLSSNSSRGHVKQISLLDEAEESEEEKMAKAGKKVEKQKEKEDLEHFIKGSHQYIEDFEDCSEESSVNIIDNRRAILGERGRVADFYEDFRDSDRSASAVSI